MVPRPPGVNFYAGNYVDRLAHLRKDAAWLEQALRDSQTVFVPLSQARSLVERRGDSARVVFVDNQSSVVQTLVRSELILLGRFRDRTCFAYDFGDSHALAQLDNAEFHELRSIGELLDPDEAGLLAYARAMVLWRERHRFCGKCGSPTLSARAGHVMRCGNAECGLEQFPRLDPAIIVLVSSDEHALLGRQAPWPQGRYSTIAGYVEPGESLEDAVRREVMEETGIEIEDIEYHSSQPWPFPASIMLGFSARAASDDIVLNDAELEEARWFTRADIASGRIALPPPQSISLRLIEHWYDQGAARPLRAEPQAKISSWARR